MKIIKIVLILLVSILFTQCDDNSSSDSGGSTVTPQYAYITDGSDLKIIDVATPSAPTLVNSITLNTSYFVSVSPDIAYVAQYDAIAPYLSLVSIGNPSSLSSTDVPKSSANNFSILSDMYTIQGIGYLTDLYRGLNTVNLLNSPFISTSNMGADAMSVTRLNDHIYIIDQMNGLSKYSIATPNAPTFTNVRNNTDIDTSSYGTNSFGSVHSWVENDGYFIYVANIYDKKLKKFDPVNLTLISEVSFEGYATAFAIKNGYAFITSQAGPAPLQTSFDGVSMFDLSTMTLIDFKSLNRTSGVALHDDYCYVTDADGLHIYDVSSSNLTLVNSFANGFGNYIALGQ